MPAQPSSLTYPGAPTVIANLSVGLTCPWNSTFDPKDGYVYMVDDCGDELVSVLSGPMQIALLNVPTAATALTYDPVNGLVYVAGIYGNLWTLQGTQVLANVTVGTPLSGGYPNYQTDVLFDPANGLLYAIGMSGNISVVSGTTVLGTVDVNAELSDAVVDPATGAVYAEDVYENNVTVIEGTQILATIPVGTGPVAGAFDAADGEIYIANGGSDNVSVISGATVVATVPVGPSPGAPTFDPSNDYVYVPNFNASAYQNSTGTGSVSVLSGADVLATVNVNGFPTYATVDAQTGTVYVVDSWGNNVSLFNGTTLVGEIVVNDTPYAPATYDPVTQDLYVSEFSSATLPEDENGTVAMVGPAYLVTFDEHGLPGGTNWSVAVDWAGTFDGTVTSGNTSLGTTVAIAEGVGAHSFLVNASYDYVLRGLAMPGTVVVGHAAVTVNLAFVPGQAANLSFVVPSGPLWFYDLLRPGPLCVTIGFELCSSSWNVTFANLSAGQYRYLVSPVTDLFTYYTVAASKVPEGTVTVRHTNVTVVLPVRLVLYPFEFVEQGLPPGEPWSVNLWDYAPLLYGGFYLVGSAVTPHDAVTFYLPAGLGSLSEYEFLVAWGNAPGGWATSFDILIATSSSGETFHVLFTEVTYPITFDAVGLPPGTNWSVTVSSARGWWSGLRSLHSERMWSDGASSVTLDLPNGTYAVRSQVAGSSSSVPSPGPVQVSGRSEVLDLDWYAVTFHEAGLPAGANWCVQVGGTTQCTLGSTLVSYLGNGTYLVKITTAPGYWVPGPRAKTTVSGGPASLNLTFRRGGPPVLY